MTLIFGRHLLGLVLMLIFAQSVTGMWWRERLFHSGLRPTVEYLAGYWLDADVHIAALSGSASRLAITGLRIDRPDGYRIEVAEAEFRYSAAGLWRRRIDTVQIKTPHIEIFGLPTADADTAPTVPLYFPVEIGDLRISNGALRIGRGAELRQLHDLQIELHGTRHPRFTASAKLGEGEGIPMVLSGTGNWDKRPGLTLSRAEWDGHPLLDEPLLVQLDHSGTSVAGSARLPRLNRGDVERMASILNLPVALPEDFDFNLQLPEVVLTLKPTELDVQLSVPAATLRSGTTELSVGALGLGLRRTDGDWSGQGRFTLEKTLQITFSAVYTERDQEPDLHGEFTWVIGDIGSLFARLDPAWKEQLAGSGRVQGEFSHRGGQSRLTAGFAGRPATTAKPNYRFDLAPLQIRLTGELTEGSPKGSGTVQLGNRTVLSVDGSAEEVQIKLHPLALDDLRQLVGEGVLPPELLGAEALAGSAELRRSAGGFWQGESRLSLQRLETSALTATDLAVSGRFQQQKEGLSLDGLRLAGQLALPSGGGARLSGAGAAALAGETFRIDLTALDLDQGEWFSADGQSALSDSSVRVQGQIFGNRKNQRLDLDLGARLALGEVLHGAFYADLHDREVQLQLQGAADLAGGQLTARALSLQVPGLLEGRAQGLLAAEQTELRGSFRTEPLDTAFERHLKELLAASGSNLAELQLTGVLAADFTLNRNTEALALRATLRPEDFGLALAAAQLAVVGGNGALPLAYRRGPPSAGAADPIETGELRFASLAFGPAQLIDAPLQLHSQDNHLRIDSFPPWQMAGGELHIEGLEVRFEQDEPTLATRIRIDGIDLERLTGDLGMTPLTGRLSADLGEIRYADRTLSSAGQAQIQVFGGDLTVSGIRLRDPASPYRTLHGDLEFRGIDLAQLTQTLEFGEMNGIVDGHIRKLRLFGSVPSSFEAELATRDSGRRNISVKALNNLSVLSQGGLSAALSRGIYRFIDFYRYQKIGLRCTLNNDVFHLRGTARADSDEYLVYGGLLPPKIDIIAPARDISFKEMLARLQRLDRAGR